MMKIKSARTVEELATANTTVLNSVTSQLTSFVVFAEAQDTWLEIVPSTKILMLLLLLHHLKAA
jgi:hypothetical protein